MSDAGKYRWMTPEEAVKEIEGGEHIWLCSPFGGITPSFSGAPLKMLTVNGMLKDWRICRAMVPEAPTTVTP